MVASAQAPHAPGLQLVVTIFLPNIYSPASSVVSQYVLVGLGSSSLSSPGCICSSPGIASLSGLLLFGPGWLGGLAGEPTAPNATR